MSTMLLPTIKSKMTKRNMALKYVTPAIIFFIFCITFLQWYVLAEDYSAGAEPWEVLPDEVLASRIRPLELMAGPIGSPQDMFSIPRYIHQSWMSDEIPKRMSRWCQTCRALNHHWQWVLWTDNDNLKLVETYFPWFLDTYLALPAEINRADTARNMYMYLLGGVYADLDTECLQPFDDLFLDHNVQMKETTTSGKQLAYNQSNSRVAFFGRMGFDGTDTTLYHTIPNAWMAASPGHPFFLLVLERLQVAVAGLKGKEFREGAEELTGPVALYHAIEEYKMLLDNGFSLDTHFADNPSYHLFDRSSTLLRMEILPPENIFPYSWNNEGKPNRRVCWAVTRTFNSQKCKQRVTTNQSYAITYWSHTWNTDLRKTHDEKNLDSVDTKQ